MGQGNWGHGPSPGKAPRLSGWREHILNYRVCLTGGQRASTHHPGQFTRDFRTFESTERQPSRGGETDGIGATATGTGCKEVMSLSAYCRYISTSRGVSRKVLAVWARDQPRAARSSRTASRAVGG